MYLYLISDPPSHIPSSAVPEPAQSIWRGRAYVTPLVDRLTWGPRIHVLGGYRPPTGTLGSQNLT